MDALSFGLGLVAALLAVSPVLVWAYRANTRQRKAERVKEQHERDWSVATKVAEILGDIKHVGDDAERAQSPSRVGRPSRETDAADGLLMRFATARAAMEDYQKLLIYVTQHGGSPDDSPAKVMQVMKGKDSK